MQDDAKSIDILAMISGEGERVLLGKNLKVLADTSSCLQVPAWTHTQVCTHTHQARVLEVCVSTLLSMLLTPCRPVATWRPG